MSRNNQSNRIIKWLVMAGDFIVLDAMMNLTNIIAGYNPKRKWETSAYLRMGIITQFVEGSASPLGGAGIEETYRLNDKWKWIL